MYSALSLRLPTGPGSGPRNWDILLNAVARAEVLWLSLRSVAASWDASGEALLVLWTTLRNMVGVGICGFWPQFFLCGCEVWVLLLGNVTCNPTSELVSCILFYLF